MRTLEWGMNGPDVKEIQSLLKRLAFDPGTVDGCFGQRTQQAVKAFQRLFGLSSDGIIGVNTSRVIESFFRGYDTYTIGDGDSFYSIARHYGVNPALIRAANYGVEDYSLEAGLQIKVPYGISVVQTDIDYSYNTMQRNVASLSTLYPFIEAGIAGRSVLGRNLYYIRLGQGHHEVFFNGAHHALEWITAPLLMKFAEDFARCRLLRQNIAGYAPDEIWNNSSIYLIPMVNPDGVDLVLNGLPEENPYHCDLIKWNNNSCDFLHNWQANVRGVDLNHNYDASWEQSKAAEEVYGIFGPGPTRYSGPYAESEPESRAVADFTRSHDFQLVLALHSQGEEIFWNYQDMASPEAREIGEMLAKTSGYSLGEASGIASYAGYKDWFIKEYGRPGYTVEVGLGQNPLPIAQFEEIYGRILPMLLLATMI